jgi:two-component sensor histidine kinase
MPRPTRDRFDAPTRGFYVADTDLLPDGLGDEELRLATLHSYDILDSDSEPAFDKITKLAANLFNVPVALVTFIDDKRQWFKSAIGTTATEVPRSIAFCTHTVVSGHPTIVLDAVDDARFVDNPMVVGAPGIRFNVSVPLRAPDGTIPGTICIVDTVPRQAFSAHDLSLLNDLADVVMAELTLRLTAKEKDAAILERDVANTMLDDALDFSEVAIWRLDIATGAISWRGATQPVWGADAKSLSTLDDAFAAIHPEDRDRVSRDMEAGRSAPTGYRSEFRIVATDGRERWLAGRGNYETSPAGDIMTGVNYDITARKQRDTHREMLMGEMRHRMRNLFANIHAIISLTRPSATSIDDYVRRIGERLAALTRTQNMLFSVDVESCSLAALLNDLQIVYPQITWTGEDVELPESAIVAFSLVFNELLTNAVKYGALATAAGSVSIRCRVTSRAGGGSGVELEWVEAGGSSPTTPPTSTGFGTQLIEMSIRDTLKGTIARRWDLSGLQCTIQFECEAAPRVG